MQKDLFGISAEKPQQKKDLVIIKQGKQVLTKQQKDFNRLVKKIETLRADIERVAAALDKKLTYYAAEIHPLEERMAELRITGVKIFFPYCTGEKKLLTKKEKDTLKEIIGIALDEVFSLSAKEPDEELKTIYKAVNGESYEDAKKEMFNDMRDEMEEQFRQEGFHIDMSEINEDMSQEEMMEKMKEMQEEFARQAEEMTEKKANRKKTKKQLEQEERDKQVEEARKKSIGSIYKQLAKTFHPDLETDEALKLQKEDIMKQLTVAYENNDLHTLLKLEMEWMQKENNDPAKLSNDKLAIYNEALKEQVMELEIQVDALEDHPRFVPLHRFSNDYSPLHTINLVREKKQLEEAIVAMEQEEAKLNGNNSLKFIKEIIASFNSGPELPDNMEDLLKEFIKNFR